MNTAAAHTSTAIDALKARSSTGKQLIGMPVISLSDGERQGDIHDVVYNPEQGRLIGFTVLRGGGFLSRGETFWLNADSLHALGEDAVTVDDPSILRPVEGSVKDVEREAGEAVLGKRLMTEGGKFLGNVDDVLIDRQTRRVVAYEVSGGVWQDMMRGQTAVPVDNILSIGSDVAVVPDFVQEHVEEPTGGLIGAAESAKGKASAAYDTAAHKVDQARVEVAETIEGKEADYARGRTAGRDVTDDAGNVLVRAGETITGDHIVRAVAAGKMHALAAAAGQAHASEVAGTVRGKVAAAGATAREKAADVSEAAREKAADLSEAAQDRQADLLIGKTTGRAVLTDGGQIIVPADHVVTAIDVAAARAAGRLNDLTAAVGAGALEATRERAAQVYESARERAADVAENVSERVEVITSPRPETPTAVRVDTPAGGTPAVVVVEQPVVVEKAPDADARLRQAQADEDALASSTSATPNTSANPKRP